MNVNVENELIFFVEKLVYNLQSFKLFFFFFFILKTAVQLFQHVLTAQHVKHSKNRMIYETFSSPAHNFTLTECGKRNSKILSKMDIADLQQNDVCMCEHMNIHVEKKSCMLYAK